MLARLAGLASAALGGAANTPVATATAAAGAMVTLRHIHAGRLVGQAAVWEEVLRVAQSNPEKLREIVDVLTNHCINAQTAPPLHHYNELLRICEAHGHVASIHSLCQMACAVRMHLDHTTFERLNAAFQYFPKPLPSPGAGLSSSPSSTGRIREAPPFARMPDASTTGGASSVSTSSISSVPSMQRGGSVTVSDVSGASVTLPARCNSSSSSYRSNVISSDASFRHAASQPGGRLPHPPPAAAPRASPASGGDAEAGDGSGGGQA